MHAGEYLDQRGLAGAVLANQSRDAAGIQLEFGVDECARAAKGLGDAAQCQYGGAHLESSEYRGKLRDIALVTGDKIMPQTGTASLTIAELREFAGFTPSEQRYIKRSRDSSYGMTRVEELCARCGSHLGHVFPDGPRPTGERHCLNSVALSFTEAGTALPDVLKRGAPEGVAAQAS